jgi:two-component system OmpR family sensor kinase
VLARLSLRARLILAVIALAAVGLAVADLATYASLRGFLLDQTDSSLAQSQNAIERGLEHGCADDGQPLPGASPGDVVQVRTDDGQVVCTVRTAGFGETPPSPPVLPTTIEVDDSPGAATYLTVPAEDGNGRFRVRASDERGAILLHATPLDDMDATLQRLLWIELLVTAAVLAALALLGLWVVRLSLRPLDEIGDTAAAIAAGDLSRRVERAEPRTEVGRLGLALNEMLARIESAFRAREASEAQLRRFVADASHELRTPLAAVRAYAELFGRGAAERPDDLARSMQGISRESERMSLLVDDLLLLARLDEGRPLERETVRLDDVVAEAVETAQTVEPDRPISLAAESATVLGDRDRLRQAIDNLLANVRAHTPPATPVEVALARNGGTVVLTVADDGPGMEAEEVAHAFERFYRADPSRARASGGVGLGLSIVAAVAAAHGGSVSARSEAGAGATFEVVLPLMDANGDGGTAASTASS